MDKKVLKFMPDYQCNSLWAVSPDAYEKFGYEIKYEDLGLSERLIKELDAFDDRVLGIIDWEYPGGESPMSAEDRKALYEDARALIDEIIAEIGNDYEIIDDAAWILGQSIE